MVERYPILGGVCLNVGCIPSKALLHVAKVIAEAETAGAHGVAFGTPEIDLDALRSWKEGVVAKLTGGLKQMAKGRKVQVVTGEARFTGPNMLAVLGDDGETTTVSFDHAIVAAGSRSVQLDGIPHDDPRVMDSTGALELADVPERLLVVGGGIIGLEMATVYDALGSQVTVVELADGLIPGADRDLVKPLAEAHRRALRGDPPRDQGGQDRGQGRWVARQLLRRRRGRRLRPRARRGRPDPERRGAGAGARGGARRRARVRRASTPSSGPTSPHIYAIGDVAGGPMLAHKATAEGHVAAEVIAGHAAAFEPRGIPSVAYTDPEVAWVGLTETEAAEQSIAYEKSVFPWSASGRALAIDGADGLTKLLRDPETGRVLGAGIVGPHAGRSDRRAGLRAGDGRRRRRPRPDDPRAPDAERDDHVGGRDRRRYDHRSPEQSRDPRGEGQSQVLGHARQPHLLLPRPLWLHGVHRRAR